MATGYDDAVGALYRAPHEAFVEERSRLSAELKAQGDKNGAGLLAKLRRPPLSAWVVNQLWWQAQEGFEALFATAERLRAGDLSASAAHRQALTELVGRAESLLEAGGHPATEATLRRVTATLSALAATGSFAPAAPGALSSDRDPPGFDALGDAGVAGGLPESSSKLRSLPAAREQAEARRREQGEEQRQQAEAAAERRQLKAERAKIQAERQRLEVALRAAKREADAQTAKIDRLKNELSTAETLQQKERSRIEELEARLRELDAGVPPR